MLTITPRQLAAFGLAALDDRMRAEILGRLVEMEYCDVAALEAPALRAALNREMDVAARHGVVSVDGYVEVISSRFELGDDWMDRPAVRAVFNGEPRDEHELLAALYSATANPGP